MGAVCYTGPGLAEPHPVGISPHPAHPPPPLPPPPPMLVELYIPGLLWPLDALKNAARDLPLPGLATLLGRGRVRWSGPATLEDLLAARAGVAAAEAPWAAWRLVGDGCDPAGHAWLCADPVHLRFARDFIVLDDLAAAPPTRDEADALVAALGAEFGATGEFIAVTPQRWYLRLDRPPALTTHPLRRVAGRRIDSFLPGGPDAAAWRRLANEAQILLHTHAVSERREAAGLPPVNSLWFWGAGRLPAAAGLPATWSDDPLARGLAGAAGRPLPARAADLLAAAPADAAVVLDRLETPCLAGDLAAWRARLAESDLHWLAPLVAALYAGRVDGLRLRAPGDAASLELALDATDRWRFWRRPRAFADLALPPAP